MNRGLNFVMFATGAVLGSVVTWHFVKKKYERIAQEEIDSVKEIYKNTYTKNDIELTKSEIEMTEKKQTDIDNYRDVVEDLNYSSERQDIVCTHVITPDEFAELDDWEVVSLTYFEGDNILSDDRGVVYDIDKSIGRDSLESFGEYEDDVVHVRNNSLETDFEVFLDVRKYSEVYSKES